MNKQKQKQRKGKFDFFSQTKQNKTNVRYSIIVPSVDDFRLEYNIYMKTGEKG